MWVSSSEFCLGREEKSQKVGICANLAWSDLDIDPDSFFGFSGKISNWTFRIIAEKDILVVVHSGKYGDPSQWCAPRDGQHGILAALPCAPCPQGYE